MKPYPKDAYRLWWEYLKLSDDYKEFCDLLPYLFLVMLSGRAKKPRGPVPKRKPATKDAIFLDRKWKNARLNKFKNQKIADDLLGVFYTFGDVFYDSFDDFWERAGKELASCSYSARIYEFSLLFKMFCWHYEEFYSEGKPDLKEFQEYVLAHLTDDPYSLYLQIDLTHPASMIEKQVKDLIKRKAKNKKVNSSRRVERWLWRKNLIPTPNYNVSRSDEIGRYLKVVQAYKVHGLRGESAFLKIHPDKKYKDDEDIRIKFYADKRKGERIIKNVERGYFPGYYEENTPTWLN